MGKLVIFEIEEGSYQTGFPVKVKVWEEGKSHPVEIPGRLPPALAISQSYQEWQNIYLNLPNNWLITIPDHQITNHSTVEACQYATKKFEKSLKEWLNQPLVRQLEYKLLQKVGEWQNVRFILKTQDVLLQKLPWHLWDIFHTSYPYPEIVVSSEYIPSKSQLEFPVKILAVLGYSQGIDIQEDLKNLEKKLPGAKIVPLSEPSSQDLREKLWTQSWDILFFAGHSRSQPDGSSGEIHINANQSLSLNELRPCLTHAVKKGLKLAIFNSCDGLGLARDLADVRIPHTIVMREPIPDVVAQSFLKYFLTAFAAGESLYASVQQARIRLHEELEKEYPCASWLPVIFQNPVAVELKYPKASSWKKKGAKIALATLGVGCLGAILWHGINEIKFGYRFSSGDKILDNQVMTLDKQEGVKAYLERNYERAISKFESSLRYNRDDPETAIYLNNSRIGGRTALTIGVAIPIGLNRIIALEILRGVAQAQEEINNQGGLNSKFLKIEIANDDNNPQIAQQVADQFVQKKDILAVVGHNSSDASVPASGKYQKGKLVMISPTSSTRTLTERNDREDSNNYIYRTVINFNILANNLAEYAKTAGKSKIGICYDPKAKDQSFGIDFQEAIVQRGGQLVDINCNLAAENLQPEIIIKTAKDKGVEAILLNPQVDKMSKALEVAKENSGSIMLLGNPSLQTKTTLDAGKAVNGMVMAVPWHPVESNKDFVQSAYKRWGDADSVTWRTATAFDATKTIAAALKQKDSSRDGVQQALSENFSLPGATGTIKFLPSGDRVGNAVLVQVQPDSKAPTGYRFVPINSIQNRISLGEKILVHDNPSEKKQSGVQAFATKNYQQAIAAFEASLKDMVNDSEARIYLQNARAALKGKSYKIAVSVPIDRNLNVAKEILQGVALAQEEVNENGGIQGHFLQVKIASDDNSPEIAQKLAHFLVADKQVLAVIGHNASDASAAACPIYQQGKLVNISSTSFSLLKLPGCGSYIFRTAPNIRSIANALSQYAVKIARTNKLAICADEKALDNQSFRNELSYAIASDGGNIVNINCDLSAPDFNVNKIIEDAISSNVDGLVLAPHVDRINKALDLAIANKGRLRLFASPTLYTYQTLQQGQSDVNGLVLAVPWHSKLNFNNDFGKNAKKYWGSSLTWRSATSYDATVAIIQGLQQSNSRDELQQVLRNPNFSTRGATGKIQFLQSGERYVNEAFLVQIQSSKTSPTSYEFSSIQ